MNQGIRQKGAGNELNTRCLTNLFSVIVIIIIIIIMFIQITKRHYSVPVVSRKCNLQYPFEPVLPSSV
jgi:hypothetical protein